MSKIASSSRTAPQLSAQPFDVIVVGAGIVGSALAFSLARSGRQVLLLERDLSEPDRIVGELLQPGGVRALKLIGLEACLDGIDAVPVEGYQVFYRGKSVPIPYPEEADRAKGLGVESGSGKVEGRSFHHGHFVQALRRRAASQKGVTILEGTVRELLQDDQKDPWKVTGVELVRKISAELQRSSKSTSAASPDSAASSDSESKETSSTALVDETLHLHAPLTIVADGCFSKFRKSHGSSIPPVVRSNFVGLELYDAPLPSPHHGHVVLGEAGPILLYQIGARETRILIDVPGEKLPSVAKGDLQKHIYDRVIPSLPNELASCLKKEMDAGNQRLRSMPNSFLPPSMQGQSKSKKSGVIVVGDAMNMRHPLTGGGMSVGLWDVVHLTNVLTAGEWAPIPEEAVYLKRVEEDSSSDDDPAEPKNADAQSSAIDLHDFDSIRPHLRAWHWRRKHLSSVINILAQALYSLFGADDENLEVLREGCFKYFELGGDCVGGPVSLLSGIAQRPGLLVYHFFRVALYAIYTLFTHERVDRATGERRVPSYVDYPGLVLRSIMVFWTACVVLLPVIFTEIRANVPSFVGGAGHNTPGKHKSASGGGAGASLVDRVDGLWQQVADRTTLLIVAAAAILAWVYTTHSSIGVTGGGGGAAGGGGGILGALSRNVAGQAAAGWGGVAAAKAAVTGGIPGAAGI